MRSWTVCRPTIEAGGRITLTVMREIAASIGRHLPVTAVPKVPGLRLHLAGPQTGLGRLLAGTADVGPPYWAHVWSGGLVLARYLLDHPATVAGHRILDLGCGSGLVAIAAARSGASDVIASDIDPYAVAATRLNAALNGVAVDVRLGDLLEGSAPEVDLVLVGDLFYEAVLARRVAAFLDRSIAAGCTVLVGDPGRAPLPRARLQPLRFDAVPDFGAGRDDGPSAVYRYIGGPGMSVRGGPP